MWLGQGREAVRPKLPELSLQPLALQLLLSVVSSVLKRRLESPKRSEDDGPHRRRHRPRSSCRHRFQDERVPRKSLQRCQPRSRPQHPPHRPNLNSQHVSGASFLDCNRTIAVLSQPRGLRLFRTAFERNRLAATHVLNRRVRQRAAKLLKHCIHSRTEAIVVLSSQLHPPRFQFFGQVRQ